MASYWVLRGRADEGRRLVAAVLAAAETSPVPPAVRARALVGAGTLFNRSGEFARARAVLEEALDIARRSNDRRSVAVALNDLAWLANRRDELDVAASYAAEALATAEGEGEVHLAGRVHATLGDLAERAHDLTAARRHFERAEEMLASVGDRVGAAKVANNLGLVDMMLGDLPRARRAMELCLGVFSELQDAASLPTVLSNLGVIALAEGQPVRAGELFARALRLGRNAGDTELVVYATLGLAVTAGDTGADERAAVLHGVVDSLASGMGLTLDALEQELRDRSRAGLRASLGVADFDAAVRRGALMSDEVAMTYALAADAPSLVAGPRS
jgi:tetratricopeptide (TPR) repeat protein